MRTILLVHGMGQTTADEFRQSFIDSSKEALSLYGLDTKWDKASEQFSLNYAPGKWENARVLSFGYNDLFEARRQTIGDESKTILERLESVEMRSIPKPGLLTAISKLGKKFGEDKFFQTHFGDVLMYAFAVVGEQIRVALGQRISGLISSGTHPNDIHIVAHSLGTAVAHDSLALLSAKNETQGNRQLNLMTHKLGSLHMIANVSRVLAYVIDVDKSSVRPGSSGCVSSYLQYNNNLDPFTRVAPFRARRG